MEEKRHAHVHQKANEAFSFCQDSLSLCLSYGQTLLQKSAKVRHSITFVSQSSWACLTIRAQKSEALQPLGSNLATVKEGGQFRCSPHIPTWCSRSSQDTKEQRVFESKEIRDLMKFQNTEQLQLELVGQDSRYQVYWSSKSLRASKETRCTSRLPGITVSHQPCTNSHRDLWVGRIKMHGIKVILKQQTPSWEDRYDGCPKVRPLGKGTLYSP